MLYIIHEKMFLGVNITTYQELVGSVNFFEDAIFWVRSVNFVENIIFGQKCKLFREYHFWSEV